MIIFDVVAKHLPPKKCIYMPNTEQSLYSLHDTLDRFGQTNNPLLLSDG